ncbi:hypothetical protein [Sphingobacterium prati]|nr:hypothetical protein [Sphingobacterium prati]
MNNLEFNEVQHRWERFISAVIARLTRNITAVNGQISSVDRY